MKSIRQRVAQPLSQTTLVLLIVSVSASFLASYYIARNLQRIERQESLEIFAHSIEPLLARFDIGDMDNVIKEISAKNGLEHIRLVDPFGGFHETDEAQNLNRQADMVIRTEALDHDSQWRVEVWWGEDLNLLPLAIRISMFNTLTFISVFLLAWLSLRKTLIKHVIQPIQTLHQEVSVADTNFDKAQRDSLGSIELEELRNSFHQSLIDLTDFAAAQTSAIERERLANAMVDRAGGVAGISILYSFGREDAPDALGVQAPPILHEIWKVRFSPIQSIRESIRDFSRDSQAVEGSSYSDLTGDMTTTLTFSFEVETKDNKYWNIYGVKLGSNGFAIISIDATERKNSERARIQSHKMEGLGVIVSGVAHDVNNILATISGALELETISNRPQENINVALNSVKRGAVLVQQLLHISREKKQTSEIIKPSEVFDDLAKIVPALLGPQYELKVTIQSDNSVQTDRDIFQTTLINLITNARDAMPEGGSIQLISRSMDKQDQGESNLNRDIEYVAIDIIDEGEGINPHQKANIFDPFFTTKATGKGTGLGLSMAYSFVSSVGGSIGVRDRKNSGGTIFTIYLPETLAKAELSTQHSPEFSALEQGTKLNVLIVEDELDLQRTTSKFLSHRGVANRCVDSVTEAKKMLGSASADSNVLIVDMLLPDGVGLEVIQYASTLPNKFYQVITSGNLDVDSLDEADAVLLDEFIQKPYSFSDLDKLLQKATKSLELSK